MAAELVVGALLSASLEGLFKRMDSSEILEIFQRKKLNKQLLNKMRMKLLSADEVLNDAEQKQIEKPNVKKWLDELQEVIYEAQDLMDKINTKALKRKVEGGCGSASCKVRNFISTAFAANKVGPKIKEILDRLETILNEKDRLGLQAGVRNIIHLQRTPATSLVDESNVYGRNSDKEAIIKHLFPDDDVETSGNNISVIPIVGMGGIGKTTLAQLIYNDDRVVKCFDRKVWVHVSEEFDIFRITKTIADRVVTGKPYEGQDLDGLQVALKEALEGKKFLLVLDDVWNERYTSWDELRKPFESGASGSKIIVTTRNEGVASAMRDVPSYPLGTLSGDDCWELFVKHAFNNEDRPCDHPKLEEIGRKIVDKCQGLPLAIKSLAGLLRHQLNPDEWVKILNSDMWKLPLHKNSILPALWLSYHHLPAHLKRCFAYCSLFPKNHEIDKGELIKLWMAEDLIQLPEKKRVDEVGEEYFQELLSRSLFQQSKIWDRSGPIYFSMHDLVNDLATFIGGEYCLRWNDGVSDKPLSKVRHVSHFRARIDHGMKKKYEDLVGANRLRTLLLVPPEVRSFDNEESRMHMYKSIEKSFLLLSSLRVLSLQNYPIEKLPVSIGNLKSLRYLDLSSTCIEELPPTFCGLYNLQTLLLRNCVWLHRLPNDMGKLISLRYLDLTGTRIFPCPIPQGVGNLKDLQILIDRFYVDKYSNIKELQDLQLLSGSLHISGLVNVDVDDVLVANLKDKQCLNNLKYDWSHDYDDNCPPKHEEVLNGLQPHTNINEIVISSYKGEQFPNWVGDNSFCNLKNISLSGCNKCCLLPSLGQLPFLESLDIKGFDKLVKIGDEFYYNRSRSMITKPFRCLRWLHFGDMPEWQEWSFIEGDGVDHFPSLKWLDLTNCPKLSLEFPFEHCYASLVKLEIRSSCHFMKSIRLDFFPMLNLLFLLDLQSLESLTLLEQPCGGAGFQFHSLRCVTLINCPEFVSFPQGGLPAPNMQEFRIKGCGKLRSLPDHMHTLLPSLQSLTISGCPELESFGEGGLPSNLSKLSLKDCCKNFASGIQYWNLQTLTSLTELNIHIIDKALDSFPQEGLLPTTLTRLTIESPHLKALNGKALLQVVSLKRLCLAFCNELQAMPQEGLPASLTSLDIKGCPYLKSRCLRDRGEDWHKIAHIPYILLDYEEI